MGEASLKQRVLISGQVNMFSSMKDWLAQGHSLDEALGTIADVVLRLAGMFNSYIK